MTIITELQEVFNMYRTEFDLWGSKKDADVDLYKLTFFQKMMYLSIFILRVAAAIGFFAGTLLFLHWLIGGPIVIMILTACFVPFLPIIVGIICMLIYIFIRIFTWILGIELPDEMKLNNMVAFRMKQKHEQSKF